MLLTQLHHALARPPGRLLSEPRRDRERLAVRDDHPAGQWLHGREGVAGGVAPGSQQPPPGVGGRVGESRKQAKGTRGPRGHQPGPLPVPGVGHGGPEVAPARVLGHLMDGGLAQGPRAGLLRITADQLDNAQQLVANLGMFAAQQPRQLLQPAISPDPAVERQWYDGRPDPGRDEEQQPDRRGRVPHPVDEEHQEKRDQQAEDGRGHSLDHLDRPDAPTVVEELVAQSLWQLQTLLRWSEAHVVLTIG